MSLKTDLAVETFLLLRKNFFDEKGNPIPFPLRDKKNLQDDPLDVYISEILKRNLPNNASCIKAPGPLITPDIVILRPEICKVSAMQQLQTDLSSIIAIEVKKLERKDGKIARLSGLDYNTTPPCGTVRIYDSANRPFNIRCFYLFVCQEPDSQRSGHFKLTALVLCDGNILNQDFDFYLSIVGERTKQIELGTYRDGFNRQRPMLVFANPLSAKDMDRKITLIHSNKSLHKHLKTLSLSNILRRSISEGEFNEFYCYRFKKDTPPSWRKSTLVDPFPAPKRKTKTQPRGKFRLDFALCN